MVLSHTYSGSLTLKPLPRLGSASQPGKRFPAWEPQPAPGVATQRKPTPRVLAPRKMFYFRKGAFVQKKSTCCKENDRVKNACLQPPPQVPGLLSAPAVHAHPATSLQSVSFPSWVAQSN